MHIQEELQDGKCIFNLQCPTENDYRIGFQTTVLSDPTLKSF